MNAFSFHYVSLIPLHKWHAVHFTSTAIIHKVGPIFILLFTQENSQGDARWPSSATAAGEVRLDPSHTYTTTHHTHTSHIHTLSQTPHNHTTRIRRHHTHTPSSRWRVSMQMAEQQCSSPGGKGEASHAAVSSQDTWLETLVAQAADKYRYPEHRNATNSPV